MTQTDDGLAQAFSQQFITACCCNGAGYVRTNAPVGHPLFGKAIPCVCQRDNQARHRAMELRRRSGMTDNQLSEWRFESFAPDRCKGDRAAVATMREVKHICERYAADPRGWLVLQGEPGTGKTHLAYAIAAQALADGRPVYAHTVPDMLDLLRSSYKDDGYERTLAGLRQVEMLVLDDLGAEHRTDWAGETLYQVINDRYAHRLPLVLTTNNLDGAATGRIASRLHEGVLAKDGWVKLLTLPCGDYRPTRGGV